MFLLTKSVKGPLMKKLVSLPIGLLLITSQATSQELFELEKGQPTAIRPAIEASTSSSKISFRVAGKTNGGSITISGPNGYHSEQKFMGSSDTVSLYDSKSMAAVDNKLPPGRYNYRIATQVGPFKLIKDTMDNGRGDKNYTYAGTPVVHTGSFIVKGGSIQEFEQTEEANSFTW